jgi:hypothetical protein
MTNNVLLIEPEKKSNELLTRLFEKGAQELEALVQPHLGRFAGCGLMNPLYCDETLNHLQQMKTTCASLREQLEQCTPPTKQGEHCARMTKALILLVQTAINQVQLYRQVSLAWSSDSLRLRKAAGYALLSLVEKLDMLLDRLETLQSEGELR